MSKGIYTYTYTNKYNIYRDICCEICVCVIQMAGYKAFFDMNAFFVVYILLVVWSLVACWLPHFPLCFFFLQNLANLFIISICISLSLYKGNSQQSCRYAATLTLSLTIFPNFAATCYKLSHNTSVAARNECPAWRTIHSVGALTDIHGRISA